MARRGIATWLLAGSIAVAFAGSSFMGCAPNLVTGAPACEGDDDNPCTMAKCPEGATTYHVPVADSTECALGANGGVCKAGTCKLYCESDPQSCTCSSEAECPVSNACVTWACVNAQCARTDHPDMTPVDTADPNDCKKTVCISGAPQIVNDENDIPPDILGDCQKPACVNMMPSTTALDTDEPQDDECTDWSCSNGVKTNKNASVGTLCAMGACNSDGKCVDCLSAADWNECAGVCSVKLCNGEACNDGNVCKSGACADGVCCNEACTGECKSCYLAGSRGQCTNIPYYQEDPTYEAGITCAIAIAGSVCDGNGKCLRIVGTQCNQGTQCISNVCASLKCLGAPGETCSSDAQCVSMMCSGGKCN